MEREEFIRVAIQVSTWEKGTIPFRAAFDQLIAEFDRLTVEVDRWQKLADKEYWGRVSQEEANKALQSWLDRISTPYSQARYNFDLEGIENSLHGRGYWYSAKSLRAIRDYLGSQKPSEKQPKFHDAIRSNIQGLKDYRGVWHEGGIEDCPICKPKCEHKNIGPLALGGTQRCLDCHEWIIAKPFTQCPECHGTKYINRVVSCADWELHPIYVIATCLNCKGEGVI